MGVAADHQVVRARVRGQVFFLMGHADPQAAQFKIQDLGKALCPLFVVVAPHGLYRRDCFQLVQDLPAADIPAVEDQAAAAKAAGNFRPQQVVGV